MHALPVAMRTHVDRKAMMMPVVDLDGETHVDMHVSLGPFEYVGRHRHSGPPSSLDL